MNNGLAISTLIRSKNRGALAWPALWVTVLVSASASAQVQRVIGPYETENGIKVGEGRLHPYFDYEMHYDSAAGYFDYGGVPGVLRPEAVAHFRPGVRLDVPMNSSTINLDGNVDYVWYTGLITQGSTNASRLQAAADASANINQGGSVELDFGDHFARSDRTANAAIGVGIISLFNDAHLQLPIRPGGGALEIVPSGGFSFESFKSISGVLPANCNPGDTCDPASVPGMNYQNFRFGLDARWRFLPKTALTLENRIDTRSYTVGLPTNPSALVLKSTVGLAGLVSPKIATVLKLGWGQDFQNTGLHTIVALAELSYLMSETSNVKLGYLRSAEPVPRYGTYLDDRGYLEARFFLDGRLTLHGLAAFDYLSFYSGSGRSDTAVTVDLGPEYQFTKWLIGAAGYVLGTRHSNNPAATFNFTRNEAYIRATFLY